MQNLQSLDSRRLLSAVIDGGTLIVRQAADSVSISVSLAAGVARVNDDGVTTELDLGNVRRIRVFCNDVARYVSLANDNAAPLPDTTLTGGAGSEQISISSNTGQVRLFANAGDDIVTVQGEVAVTVRGGEGNDVMTGSFGDDCFYGEGGSDTLIGAYGDDLLDGGDRGDMLDGREGRDTLAGGRGDDILTGGDLYDQVVDVITTGPGRDYVYAREVRDGHVLDHDAAVDQILLDARLVDRTLIVEGSDLGQNINIETSVPYPGEMFVTGTIGTNIFSKQSFPLDQIDAFRISLGGGDDRLYLQLSSVPKSPATVYCGDGNDRVATGYQRNPLRVYGEAGNDTVENLGGKSWLYGGSGNDALRGGSSDDLLDGGSGNDTLEGIGGSDFLHGGSGNDLLYGYGIRTNGVDGNDTINGSSGDDTLRGGDALDLLTGGGGSDAFESDELADSEATDFEGWRDRVL